MEKKFIYILYAIAMMLALAVSKMELNIFLKAIVVFGCASIFGASVAKDITKKQKYYIVVSAFIVILLVLIYSSSQSIK